MALPTQLVPLPLVGGLDDSKAPEAGAPGSWLILQNLVYQQDGALVRRDGSEPLPTEAQDGFDFPLVDHLDVLDDELLAIGTRENFPTVGDPQDAGPYLWSWSETLQTWAPRSQVTPGTLAAAQLVTVSDLIPEEIVSYLIHHEGLEVAIWATPGGAGAVKLMSRVTDRATGAVVMKDRFVDLVTGRFVAVRVGTTVRVVANDGTSDFSTYTLDLVGLEWSGPTVRAVAAGGVSYWDACPIDDTYHGLCYVLTATGRLYVERVTPGVGASTPLLLVDSAELCSCAASPDGTTLGVAAVDLVNGRLSYWSATVATMAPVVAGTEAIPGSALDFADRLSLCLDNNLRAWIAVDARKTVTGPTQRQFLGLAAVDVDGSIYASMRSMHYTAHLTRPWVVGQRVYLAVGACPYLKSKAFLWGAAVVDLTAHSSELTSDRPIALVALLPSLRYQFYWRADWRHVPLVAEESPSTWSLPLAVSVGRTSVTHHLDRVTLSLGVASGLWRSAPANGGLVLTGACTSWYDGYAACELGFAHGPQWVGYSQTSPAASPGANASYNIVAVWEWTDGAGLVHRSEPSPVTTVVFPDDLLGVGGAQVTCTWHTLQVTRKGDLQDGRVRRPFLRVYRTLKNDPSVYYLTADLDVVTEPYSGTISVQLDEADGSLVQAARGILYTVGGRLEHRPPPPSCAAVQAKRRLWLASSVAPEVWFSGELLPGEGPWFHEFMSLRLEGEEPITALASLDDKLIVFTARRIYAVTGEGPNDKGEGAFQGPYLISSSAGCVDARSVVPWKGGVFFQSAEGLALIDRGLGVSFAGAAAQTQLDTYPRILSATLDATRERCLWALSNEAGNRGTVLWFDYGVGNPQGAWGTWVYASESGLPVTQRSHVIHQGRHVRSHAGLPYRSVSGGVLDGEVWITARLRTPYLAFASLAGAQRVRRLVLSGSAFDAADWTFRTYFDESATASQTTTLPASVHDDSRATRLVVRLDRQQGTSLSLDLQEAVPDPIPDGVAALRVTGLGLEVGVAPGVARVTPQRRR